MSVLFSAIPHRDLLSSLLVGLLLVLIAPVLGQSRDQQPFREDEFRRKYEEALAKRKENLCPHIQLGPDKVPLLSWMCGSPITIATRDPAKYTYDCCPGYGRTDLVGDKCVFVERSWLPIVEFLQQKGHEETAQALTYNSATPDLVAKPSKSVYTVFVPKIDNELNSGEVDYTRSPNAPQMMIHEGRVYSRDFKNGAKVKNEHGVDMKITSYSTGLLFIECRMLMSVDQETENGLIHMTDGPLPPTYEYRDVMSRLEANPGISDFVRALPNDVKSMLRRPQSATWYSVFAPSNEAWRNAVQRLNSPEEISKLARQHVLPKMICSRAVTQGSSKIEPTLADESFRMGTRPDGTTYIIDNCAREINFVKRDMMSENGVVHEVDRVISSHETQDLNGVLTCLATDPDSKVSQAARQLTECPVNTGPGARKVIVLPTNEALAKLPRDVADKMRQDVAFRCNVYSYGALTPPTGDPLRPDVRGLNQAKSFSTDYRAPNNEPTYVTNTYVRDRTGSQLWFNDAKATDITGTDFRDGVIYSVDKVNLPPTKTMKELVKEEPDTKIISGKIDSTRISSDWRRESPKVLFLAPLDMGWKTRKEVDYPPAQMESLLKLHTIPQAIYGGKDGFVWRHTVQELPTLLPDGKGGQVKLLVKRYLDGTTFIGHEGIPEKLWAMVVNWNKVGTDGLVWIIDWPIKCPNGLC